jgi:hypothetical protein
MPGFRLRLPVFCRTTGCYCAKRILSYPTHHLTQDALYLRIARQGNDWGLRWKLHHDDPWTLLTTLDLALEDHRVGIGVKTFEVAPSGQKGPGQASFDYI